MPKISPAPLIFKSCSEIFILGCTDSISCNYNSQANINDNSCFYNETYYDCDGNCVNDSDNDGICDELEIISKDKNKKTLLTLSIEELENYQLELLDMIDLIKKEIEKRKSEIKKAEGFFKKK